MCLDVAMVNCGNDTTEYSCDLCGTNCGGDCIYKYSYGNWSCHPIGNQIEKPSCILFTLYTDTNISFE